MLFGRIKQPRVGHLNASDLVIRIVGIREPGVNGYEFAIGDCVVKPRGYSFPGVIVAVFTTLAGEQRYVVECVTPECAGMLHIYNGGQLAKRGSSAIGDGHTPAVNHLHAIRQRLVSVIDGCANDAMKTDLLKILGEPS